MSQADWTLSSGSLGGGSIAVVETAALTPPPGGGSFLQAFNSLTNSMGVYAYFQNGVDFAPAAKGGIITGCLKKGISGGPTGWTPFLAICWQGAGAVTDQAYLLGFSDANPSHLVLRKGQLTGGMPDATPPVNIGDPIVQGVLRRSTDVYAIDQWVHLRLMVAANLNGDAVITCWQNNLSLHPIGGSPTWVQVPGMTQFIDDQAGIASGTPSFLDGYMGYGSWFNDVTRRAHFDELTVEAQS